MQRLVYGFATWLLVIFTLGCSGARSSLQPGGSGGAGGNGGALGTGGRPGSGGSGMANLGGTSGPADSGVVCPPVPCVVLTCPYGRVAADECDCSGPCDCPCGCWACAPGPESPDASPRTDVAQPDASASDTPVCPPVSCPATSAAIQLSGSVDLTGAGASGGDAGVEVDGLVITVCRDATCAVLPREPSYDATATSTACPDTGSACVARAFGGNQPPIRYAFVTLTSTGGRLYAVGGTVMFPFSSSVADVASNARITIRSGDIVLLDAASSACTVSFGCCGGNQTCDLSWD